MRSIVKISGVALLWTALLGMPAFADSNSQYEPKNLTAASHSQHREFAPISDVEFHNFRDAQRARGLRAADDRQNTQQAEVNPRAESNARRTARMTPEERRALRQQINDAGHQIYVPSR